MLVSRTLIGIGVASATLLSVTLPAFAWSDVTIFTPYNRAIEYLRAEGIVEGYADNTYKPSARINRAEFLKIILESRGEVGDASECFPDVEDEWFARYVCTAKAEGIIQGYPDGNFRPEREINFVEAAKILALAYDQPVEAFSPDWYEPYARSLETSAAIPPSIANLEHRVTRGEMAEMMWRLHAGVRDQPAKGFLNVKYPEVTVNLSSDVPQRAGNCADLRAFTEEAARSGGMGIGVMMKGGMMRAVPATGAPMLMEDEAVDSSQTNVQVAGVDEGDIVKTDGTYLYMIRNQEVRIVRARPSDDLENVAIVPGTPRVSGTFTPSDLYVEGDRLVVIGTRWDQGDPRIMFKESAASMIWPGPWASRSYTEVRIYDITDRSKPELTRTVSFEGSHVSTRRIEDRLIVVVTQPPRYWGSPVPLPAVREMDIMPTVIDSAHGEGAEPVVRCGDVVILPHVPTPSYLVVGVVPIENATAEVKRTAVLGSAENVYASLENLLVAATDWQYAWNRESDAGSHQRTRLFRFAFTGDGVSFRAQGWVPGRILDQFSMDEHDGYFRIATTRDQEWEADGAMRVSSNNLYVMSGDMEVVGSIEDIAPGEQIYSTRFLGDRAYMVTFKKIDPFFVIDASDPRNPHILGKLKIPGYSDYLHPYDADHILGFGKEAVTSKEGDFAWYQGMKVALFDVSDVEHPVEKHRITIGDRGTESSLLQNHKALLFEKDRNLLAFPIRVHAISELEKQQGDPASAWGTPVFQGAHVYTLTLKDGFTLRGTVTHYADADMQKAGDYLYGKDIERIVRMGDALMTVSPWGVKSADEETVGTLDALSFEEEPPYEGTCPDDADPDVHYVSKDPEQCALMRFSCLPGTEVFSSTCGCGCRGE